ncbi:MAG: mechanosensitive ion channel family protein [Reyranella sp.]|uniref:mechanosensitive ion channel family protein n=1 Tax=Reyranella sp. TaxID=1929291 RepID=UPI001ACC4B07|nr:mechanosensitive ion channel family protein [Reyranella sp.]MBN9090608.1 mechanosensitive ion channel family protein [Reyranella sp.]
MHFEEQWTNAANTLVALITTYGLRVVGAIVILAAGWMASRLLYNAVERLLARTQRIDRTVTLFLANAARYLVLILTFSAVLSTFGVATTSFVAVIGALGIAVGLALQGTLSSLSAGIMLVLFRPFHIGDRIEAGGIVGTVREINLFYSELDTDDNVRVIFPNGKLWGEIVKVPSRNDTERVELKFTRPASDDLETAIARAQELVDKDRRIERVAQIGVDTVNDGNYVLVIRAWVARPQAMQVRFDLNRAVKEEFQRRAPQREEARAAD